MSASKQMRIFSLLIAVVAAATLAVLPAQGAGKHSGGHHHGPAIGKPGKAELATRTIRIEMTDNAYTPKSISVSRGETIRFVVVNKGELVHEFNIGTAAMHAVHKEEMAAMVDSGILEADRINHEMMKEGHGMAHDDPNSVLLEPGASGEIVWTFSAKADLEMACNVPGHYEDGMVGAIRFH